MIKKLTFLTVVLLGIFVILNTSFAKINSYEIVSNFGYVDQIILHVNGFLPVGTVCNIEPESSGVSFNNSSDLYNVIINDVHVFGGASVGNKENSGWKVVGSCSDATINLWTLWFSNLTVRSVAQDNLNGPYVVTVGNSTMSVVDTVTVYTKDIWECVNWTSCSAGGSQTRTCSLVADSPSENISSPATSQSCAPPCTANSWSCADWNQCSADGSQTRACNKTNCQGGIASPETTQSCTFIPPVCASWTYSDWSSCSSGGNQVRDIISSSPDNCTGGSPVLSQSCNYAPPVPVPKINSIEPNPVYEYDYITISGENFEDCYPFIGGNNTAAMFLDGVKITSDSTFSWEKNKWTNGQIVYAVSGKGGKLKITNCDGLTSNEVDLVVVKRNPVLTSVEPNKVYVGSSVIVNGSDFGNTDPGSSYQFYLNGEHVNRMYVGSWTNSSFKLTIPSELGGDTYGNGKVKVTPGDYELQIRLGKINNTWVYSNKITFTILASCNQDNWECGEWGECSVSGKKQRTCTKAFDCPSVEAIPPDITKSCTYAPPAPTCNADIWSCGAWGSCSPSGVESRSCNKTFDCPSVETAPPTISEYCTPPNLEKYQISPADQQVVNQNNIIKATVNLFCLQINEKFYSVGSGTIIDSNGTILTNKHVVADTVGCRVGFVESYKNEPYFGDKHIADIVKTSINADIAILKLRNPSKKILTYIDITRGSSDMLDLEDKIITYGYPTAFGTKITLTRGDFSGVEGDFLKTTAIIDKGNSGGGAYLQDGTFIGMPTKIFPGTFNNLGGILSVNTIKSWLSGTSLSYNDESYNKYSRVSSVLENIDLRKLDTLKLFISDTDVKGNNITPIVAPTTNQRTQEATEQSQSSQTQKESTVIESVESNPKIKQKQNNLVSPKNEFIEKQGKENKKENGNNAGAEILEQRRSLVAETVQEIVKIVDSNIGIGQQVKVITQTQVQNQEKLEISMKKIQSRNGLAKFFVGSDYGEIKISKELLEQNKKQIKNLKQLGIQLSKKDDQQKIAEQIKLLEQANQQMETSLNEAKKGFSLFGWVFRIFAK